MEKLVFCVYDMQADYYEDPMVFQDPKVAVGAVRRSMRDMYLRKQVTLDALRDRKLVCVGMFDSVSGTFYDGKSDVMNVSIRLSDFVLDLVGENVEVPDEV